MFLQTLQPVVPKAFVLREPISNRTQAFGDDLVATFPAVTFLRQEASLQQDTEVLRDGGAAHLEVLGHGVYRMVGLSKEVEHLAARGMTNRSENVGFALGTGHHPSSMRKEPLTCQDEANVHLAMTEPVSAI